MNTREAADEIIQDRGKKRKSSEEEAFLPCLFETHQNSEDSTKRESSSKLSKFSECIDISSVFKSKNKSCFLFVNL